jgi:2-isopropylmalate synthase
MTKIYILDTTLHSLQDLNTSISLPQKIKLAVYLNKLGVKVIDLGKITSSSDLLLAEEVSKFCNSEISILVSLKQNEILMACYALRHAKCPRLQIHLEQLETSLSETLKNIETCISLAKKYQTKVLFSIGAEIENNLDQMSKILRQAIQSGSDSILLTDTKKYSTPDKFSSLIKYTKQKISNLNPITIAVECKSELGLAMANTWAGIINGATEISTSFGISNQKGNCDLLKMLNALQDKSYNLKEYQLDISKIPS